jgi:hypothetical protein
VFVSTFLSKLIENINLLLWFFFTCYNSSKDGSVIIMNVYRQLMLFIIPFVTIFFIYLKLVLHVRKINRQSKTTSIVKRAQYELRMMLRIIIILVILALGSITGLVFGFINTPPLYRWRIFYLSLLTSACACVVSIFILTTSVRQWLMRWYNSTNTSINRVQPIAIRLITLRQT